MSEERILCVRELRWNGGILEQKLLVRRDGQDIEEWREVAGNRVSLLTPGDTKWETVDWTKPNRELAIDLGHSTAYISQRRMIYGHKATPLHQRIDWSGVDWSQSNYTIASKLGIGVQQVAKGRKSLGESPHGKRIVTEEMLNAADWQKTRDADLARQWGLSRERVRQLRLSHGKPECIVAKLQGTQKVGALWLEEHRDELKGRLAYEVAREMPGQMRAPSRLSLLRRSGIELDWSKSKSYKYSAAGNRPLNWDLPNKILGMIWDLEPYKVANVRSQGMWGHAQWEVIGNKLAYKDPTFRQLVKNEIAKAKVQLGKDKVNESAVWKELESVK